MVELFYNFFFHTSYLTNAKFYIRFEGKINLYSLPISFPSWSSIVKGAKRMDIKIEIHALKV